MITSAWGAWRRVEARGGAWQRVEARGGSWRRVAASRNFWRRVGARERSDKDKISQKGRSERFLSDGAICGLIGEAEAEVAVGSGL